MKKYFKIVLISILVLFVFSSVLSASSIEINERYLNQLHEMIYRYYNEDIEKEAILGASFNGLLTDTNMYSGYQSVPDRDRPTSSKIGIQIEKVRHGFVISSVYPGSPAYEAGLQAGDIITGVAGVSLELTHVFDFNSKLPTSGEVELDLLDVENNRIHQKTVGIDQVVTDDVVFFIYDDIGFIRIYAYNEETQQSFDKAMEIFSLNQVKEVIVDMRDTHSMDMEVASGIANAMMPFGRIGQVDGKTFSATHKNISFHFHLVINHNTVGTGEWIGKAVKDLSHVTLYGQSTKGEAYYVKTYPVFSDSAYARLVMKTGRTDIIGICNHIDIYQVDLREGDITGYLQIVQSHVQDAKGRRIDEHNVLIPDNTFDQAQITYMDNAEQQTIWIRRDYEKDDLSYDLFTAKKILASQGFYSGAFDVRFDQAMEKAVNAFKTHMGMAPDGILDTHTQKLLNHMQMGEVIFTDPIIQSIIEGK